jgi:imidazole glycerol phosphate synthase subunit HisF
LIVGEILFSCIDKEVTDSGFDIKLMKHISKNVSIPIEADYFKRFPVDI